MNRTAAWTTTGAITVCVLGTLAFTLSRRASSTSEANVTAIVLRDGGFTSKDFQQYRNGHMFAADAPHTMSDKDFNWLMRHIDKSTAPPTSCRPASMTTLVSELEPVSLTPAQEAKATRTIMPLLSEEDEISKCTQTPIGLIEEYACKYFEHHPDKAAAPRLQELVNSPHPFVRYHASIALTKLGYQVTVPPKPTSPF